MRTVFFDIETQIDFLFPAGALYVPGAEKLLHVIARLNRQAAALVSTMCAHDEDDPEFQQWPPHCVAGTAGQLKAAETMRDFVHAYHEKQEDEQVFPRFKKAGRMVELVDVMMAQHGSGRKLTTTILELAPKSGTKAERQSMIDAMQASIVLYRPHVARELTDVLPTLRTLVTPNEFDELSAALDKDETEKLGKEGFDKMAKKVEALEKRIGINDISQFTPKS